MDRETLVQLARSGESETLEFKRSTGERRDAARTLCAMLNHRGGRILIGIEVGGRVVGQDVVDKTVEDIAQEIKELDPPVFPSIDRVPVGDRREVIVITAMQGQVRPYTYRSRAYKRVGNTSPEMSRDEYNRMLLERLHGQARWENQHADGWSIEDLDGSEVARTVEEAIRRGRAEDPGTRELAQLLRGLGLLRDEKLLCAAAVLFGRPELLEAQFPQCLLRVAKFKGSDKTEFVDNRQFHGNAFRLLSLAERFLRENLPVAGRVVPGLFERIDDPLFPTVALREALANAICHRDYSIGGGSMAIAVFGDRIEITSSGTLHFGLTSAALFQPHESLPWNPLIARVLYRRGIIEAWGRGTIKMVELAKRAGLPRPEIEEVAGCVTVRFRLLHSAAAHRKWLQLTERQQRIVLLLGSGPLPLRALRVGIGPDVPEWALKEDLTRLKTLGLVEPTGRGRAASWSVPTDRQAERGAAAETSN